MKKISLVLALIVVLSVIAVIPAMAGSPSNGSNGTTLAGYKTIDICVASPATDTAPAVWRYSGVISVWNTGAIDTAKFKITDFIEYKTGTKFIKAFDVPVTYSGEIPAGTTQETALTFPYSVDAAPLAGTIRNNVNLTIMNHSGHLDTPFGPNPKATYTGTLPPPACQPTGPTGCTYTQGYWGNKPDVVWPTPYSRVATFFLSGQTWQQVMDTPVNASQGYYQLAHQYIAAVLNQANGASVPSGVQTTLNLAKTWLAANAPSACTANGSCGTQKVWAATLDVFNNGLYPGGPTHCGQ